MKLFHNRKTRFDRQCRNFIGGKCAGEEMKFLHRLKMYQEENADILQGNFLLDKK